MNGLRFILRPWPHAQPHVGLNIKPHCLDVIATWRLAQRLAVFVIFKVGVYSRQNIVPRQMNRHLLQNVTLGAPLAAHLHGVGLAALAEDPRRQYGAAVYTDDFPLAIRRLATTMDWPINAFSPGTFTSCAVNVRSCS